MHRSPAIQHSLDLGQTIEPCRSQPRRLFCRQSFTHAVIQINGLDLGDGDQRPDGDQGPAGDLSICAPVGGGTYVLPGISSYVKYTMVEALTVIDINMSSQYSHYSDYTYIYDAGPVGC